MAENAVFWKQGLFLHPQHFQLMSRQIHGAIEPFCGLRVPMPGARVICKFAKALLKTAFWILSAAISCFPTGPTFACPPTPCCRRARCPIPAPKTTTRTVEGC